MWTIRLLLSALFLISPAGLIAHGGGLDALGCHHNRKLGGYHCHRGPLAGRSFTLKAEAFAALNAPEDPVRKAGALEDTSRADAATSAASGQLTAAEAKDHIGKKLIVCGTVVSARHATRSRGQPTFLNLDKPYPNQIFTVVIWGQRPI
jgi:hypothetical protein